MNRFYESPEIVDYYIKYRPSYNSEVAQRVMEFYKSRQPVKSHFPDQLDLMVDVGCGSGQWANSFQPYFKKILGFDVSTEQIKQAKLQNKFGNIEYREGRAEELPVADASVDLVVSGTATEWFDWNTFYDEVKRILKPSGCLFMSNYEFPRLSLVSGKNEELSQKAGDIIKKTITDYVEDPLLKHLYHNFYKDNFVEFFEKIPYKNKERGEIVHEYFRWSVQDTCGFIKSIEAYHLFMEKEIQRLRNSNIEVTKKLLSEIDPTVKMAKELQDVWDIPDDQLDRKLILSDFTIYTFFAKP